MIPQPQFFSGRRRHRPGNTLQFCLHGLNALKSGDVSFIQIGANDGVVDDPIRNFIVEYPSWSGLMFEPHPAYFSDLTHLYGERQNITLMNSGISDTNGTFELYHISETERHRFPAWVRGCASLNEERFVQTIKDGLKEGGGLDPKSDIASTTVELKRLDSVLEKLGKTKTDLIVIDVEGHERSVLSSFDLGELDPKLVVVENNGVDTEFEDEVVSKLSAAGMETFRLGDDLLSFHPEILRIPLEQTLMFLGNEPLTPSTLAR